MFAKDVWEEMRYFMRQKLFMAAVLLTAAGSYGFAITHESIGVDDTIVNLYLDEGLEVYMGRWTMYLLNKLFRVSSFAPFITEMAGALLLVTGVLLFCVLFRRILGNDMGILGYTVFACVFISYPFISEIWVYYYHNGVDLGYILLALSLLLFMESFENTGKKQVKYLLGSMLLLCTSVGCYESFLILYLTGILVIIFLRGMAGKEQMNRHMVWKLFLGVCLAIGCIILRTVILKLVITVFSIPDFGNITVPKEATDSLKIFAGENWSSELFMLIKRYWLRYFVNATLYFPIAEYVASVALWGIASVVLTIKKKNGWYLLLFAGMVIVPGSLTFMVGMAPLYRSCQFMPFFIAAAILLPYLILKKCRKKYGVVVFALSMLCLVWNQMYESNLLFYTDYLKYQHDKEELTTIATEIVRKYNTGAKVIFTGRYQTPYSLIQDYYIFYASEEFQRISVLTDWLDPHLKEKYYTPYGYSFAGEAQNSIIEWGLYAFGYPGLELKHFLEMHGYSLQVETDKTLLEKAKSFAEQMPKWPEEGSIAEMDGYVVVHF